MVAHESALERDFYTLLEFDDTVVSFEEQPVEIQYLHKGYWQRHTPDTLVTFHARLLRRPLLVQVKYRDELQRKWTELHPGLRAAARHARARSWDFKIYSEVEIRGPSLDNVRRVLRFRDYPLTVQECEPVLDTLDENESVTLGDIMHILDAEGISRSTAEPIIYAMIARLIIGIDWATPLSLQSLVYDHETFLGPWDHRAIRGRYVRS